MNNKEISKKRFLAIDWGKKKIGFAISDPANIYAMPIKPIENKDDSFKVILEIVKQYKINEVIIGLPLSENKEETSICKIIRQFSEKLMNLLNENGYFVSISFQNEFYSTKNAESIQKNYINKKKNWDIYKDSYSAMVILEDYLFSMSKK
ncbi:MAG: Holliday junction resolvase RuvX [Exilispira sp.]